MTMHTDVIVRQKLIIHHPELGYMKATARENKESMEGNALLNVLVNHHRLPGVSALEINVNHWDVWDAADTVALLKIVNLYLAPDVVEGR